MNSTRHLHRFLVYLCLAAVLLAAVTHAGAALPAILLVTFGIFVALSIDPPRRGDNERCAIHPSPILPVSSPRPPPIQ
ncbi:MAG TPA: hypothetical protein VKE93_08740 [Candidatus Angelobacter sp.]|nr:hypothetical protein [Candidatus Angelobacter sp.]